MRFWVILFSSFFLVSFITVDEAAFKLAKRYYNEGKYDLSAKEFEQFSMKYINSVYFNSSLYYAGRSYFYLKDYKKAIEFFNALLKNASKDYEKRQATFELARSYYLLGEYRISSRLFKDFFMKYPDSPVSHAALYYSANSYRALGENIEAYLLYEMIVSNYPESPYFNEAKKFVSLYKVSNLIHRENEEKTSTLTNIIEVTNIVYLTNKYVITNFESITNITPVEEKSNLSINASSVSNLNASTNSQNEVQEKDPLLEALKKENFKNEEDLKRYMEIIELKDRLLKIKEKLLKEKKKMVLKDELEE